MNKYETVKQAIIKELQEDNMPGICDLSDIGNLIGIAIGPYISDDGDDSWGYEKESFISGVNHGISLIDGTHG